MENNNYDLFTVDSIFSKLDSQSGKIWFRVFKCKRCGYQIEIKEGDELPRICPGCDKREKLPFLSVKAIYTSPGLPFPKKGIKIKLPEDKNNND